MRRRNHLEPQPGKPQAVDQNKGGGNVPASSRGEEDSQPPVCANVCACTHVCVCTSLHVCMCLCVCACIYMLYAYVRACICILYDVSMLQVGQIKICLPKYFCSKIKVSHIHLSYGIAPRALYMLLSSCFLLQAVSPVQRLRQNEYSI